jgi:predicted HTH domain antitoxin
MSQIVVEVPDASLMALGTSAEHIGAEMRLAAAMKWFEMGKLSSGIAAMFAGIPRTVFLTKLADFGIDTFDLTEEDLNRETPIA